MKKAEEERIKEMQIMEEDKDLDEDFSESSVATEKNVEWVGESERYANS